MFHDGFPESQFIAGHLPAHEFESIFEVFEDLGDLLIQKVRFMRFFRHT